MVTGADSIAILMGCRDGARFLPEQLASIAAQSHRNWRLVASDDGSSDATAASSRRSATRGRGAVEIRDGPRRGFAANYLGLAGDPGIRADYYAFADQDDLWDADRLARGIARLSALTRRCRRSSAAAPAVDEAGARPAARRNSAPRRGSRTPSSRASPAATPCSSTRRQGADRAAPDGTVDRPRLVGLPVGQRGGGTVIYDPEPRSATASTAATSSAATSGCAPGRAPAPARRPGGWPSGPT